MVVSPDAWFEGIRTLLRTIIRRVKHEQMDEHPLPEDDPVLRPVWVDMSPEERLAYLLAQDEQPPEALTGAAQGRLGADPCKPE